MGVPPLGAYRNRWRNSLHYGGFLPRLYPTCCETAAQTNTGDPWLVSSMGYAAGEMSISNQKQLDITSGMNLMMNQAEEIKMWIVSGQLAFAASSDRADYSFTLVEYQLYIDEVPWTIFSPIGNSLDTEFHDEFWQVVNHERKGRPEFVDIPWLDDQYDVDPVYLEGEWAGQVAFPIPAPHIGWPRHGHGRYLRPAFIGRTPPFLTWARPIFEQGALSPMSTFPADFPILCLPGDKLFQSKEVDSNHSLPPIVHAYQGNKVNLSKLQERQEKGLAPLSAALLGVEQLPPLWTHSNGCDFVRGGRFVVKPRVPASRALTSTQVLLLRSLWVPVRTPHQFNTQPPWTPNCAAVSTFCGQHASLQLPADVAQPLRLALQQKLQFDRAAQNSPSMKSSRAMPIPSSVIGKRSLLRARTG